MKKPLVVIIPALALTLAALGSVSARAAGSAMTAEGVPAATMQEIGAAAPGAPSGAALDISAQSASFPAEIETMALDAAAPAAAAPQAAAAAAPAARAAALGKQLGAQRSGIAAAVKAGGADRQINAMFDANSAASSDDASIAAGAPGAKRASGLQKASASPQNIWKAFSKTYGDKQKGFKLPAGARSAAYAFPKNTSIYQVEKIARADAASSDFGRATLNKLTVAGQTVYAVHWSLDVNWGPQAAYYLALFDEKGAFIAGYHNNTSEKRDKGVSYDAGAFLTSISAPAKPAPGSKLALKADTAVTASPRQIWKAFSQKYGDPKVGFKLSGKSLSFTRAFPQNTSLSRIYKIAQNNAANSDFGNASLHKLTIDGQTVYAAHWSVSLNWGPDAGYFMALFDKNGSFLAGYYNNTSEKGDKGIVYDVNQYVKKLY